MISITEAEKIIKSFNVTYLIEPKESGGFKTTLKWFYNDMEKLFLITVDDFKDISDGDCVFSFFINKELVLANTGDFIDVMKGLESYKLMEVDY